MKRAYFTNLRYYCTIGIFSISVVLWLFGCTPYLDNEVEAALEFAGENRSELQKVLQHYHNNPLKEKAARYLIANMPFYYSYKGSELDSIKKIKVLIMNTDTLPQQAMAAWENIDYSTLPKIYDAQIISSSYLIRNIDHAFKKWEGCSWNKNLSFEDFCEFLLPYRIGDEPLEEWREKYEKKYKAVLDSLYQGHDIIEAANVLGNYIKNEGFFDDLKPGSRVKRFIFRFTSQFLLNG